MRKAPRVLVVAVKPHIVAPALTALRPHLPPDTLVVSVAAGVTLATLQGLLPAGSRVIRCMPNVAALVGAGAAGFRYSIRPKLLDSAHT